MSTIKTRKISLINFIFQFGSEDQQINFFVNLKWSIGFLVIIAMIIIYSKEIMSKVDISLFVKVVDIKILY